MDDFDDPTEDKRNRGGEVLFEMVRLGNAVKVSALHVATNTEVSVVASAHTTPYSLKANALRKLRAALAKLQ